MRIESTHAESGTESARVLWRSRTVQVVLASTLLAPLGVPLVAPALPVIRDAFGVSDATASLLISTYFLTGIVPSPFIGLLADRVGKSEFSWRASSCSVSRGFCSCSRRISPPSSSFAWFKVLPRPASSSRR